MKDEAHEVVERLVRSRSSAWLRVVDDAELDKPAQADTAAAAVVEPYRWLLARVAEGVKLTQAGHLPPAVVNETVSALGWHDDWIGKGNREDLTLPVLELRESAQRFGLVRRYRGRLLPTVAGRRLVDDVEALWWHLAERLPDGRPQAHRQAGVAYLLMVAAGRALDRALLAEALCVHGWMDARTGAAPSAGSAFSAARDTWAMFRRLGLVPDKVRWDDPEPLPSPSGVAFARAALVGRETSRRSSPRAETAGAAASRRAVQLLVSLREVEPAVWRRLVVPASLTLGELHHVIQTAMGWRDHHLHLFDVAGVLYGDVEEIEGRGDENSFTVGEASGAGEFRYEYDFGDDWQHDIRVEHVVPSVGADTPRLAGGAGACPPEDCGGPLGYAELLDILADPSHEEYAERLEWLGGQFDPQAWDLEATNELLELYDRHTRRRRATR